LKKTISILGCGWLGLPLAKNFVKQNFRVKGSVTTSEKSEILKQSGIIPYQIKISDTEVNGTNISDFFDSDILIINFPPERREDIVSYHQAQISLLVNLINQSQIKQVLFVSSSSVYAELNREVFEHETAPPLKNSGKALLAVEHLLSTQIHFTTTIIRFAGLIGYDRHPGRFLAGKKNVANANGPINVIHQDDCLGVINEIIEQKVWGGVFNASADMHPTRKEFYTMAAKNIGLEIPIFTEENATKFKIVNSDKIKKRLNYSFKYPSPIDALLDCKISMI
jgi:nucleoside-diphosphate-sugar epimerase